MPKLHPLSHDFHWSMPTGPYRRITQEQARAYDERGYFVLEDAFAPEEVADLLREIDPFEAETDAYLREKHGGRLLISRADEITFTPHMVRRSARLAAFCGGPVFRDLVHDLIGPDVRLYWDQAVYKKPGTPQDFPWHQDNGYTFIEPQQYLTCWVALTDVSERNGCPWVVPGLHRLGTLEHWTTDLGYRCLEDPDGAVPAPTRAGGIVVFSSLTPHRTGPNLTDEVRKSYIVQFAPDGAEILRESAGVVTRTPCNAPDRQFPVLVRGEAPRRA